MANRGVTFADGFNPSFNKRPTPSRPRSIIKNSGGGSFKQSEQEEPLQLIHTAVVKPIQDWWTSIAGSSQVDDNLDMEKVMLGAAGDFERTVDTPKTAGVLTMTCTDVTARDPGDPSATKHIKVCPNDTYEDFIDFIKNEFGDFLWPVYQDPITGKRLLVVSDERFDVLCEECIKEGGRLKVHVYKKIEVQEYEL